MLRLVSIAAMLAFAAPAAAQAEPPPVDPPKVTDPSSKDYIRCRRIATTGSLARKERVCKTNAEWSNIARAGNDGARESLERSQAIYNDRP